MTVPEFIDILGAHWVQPYSCTVLHHNNCTLLYRLTISYKLTIHENCAILYTVAINTIALSLTVHNKPHNYTQLYYTTPHTCTSCTAKHKKQLYGTMYCTTINTLNRPVPCIYTHTQLHIHSLYIHLKHIVRYNWTALQHIIVDIQYSIKIYSLSLVHSSRQLYSQ